MESTFPPTLSLPSFLHIPPSFLAHILLPTLFIILILTFILYCIVSSVLVYHWNAYGMKNSKILLAKTLYFSVSATLFFTAFMALYSF